MDLARGFWPENERRPFRPGFRDFRRRVDEIQRVVTEGLEKRGYAVTRYGKGNKIEEVGITTGIFAEFEEQQSRRLTISVQGEEPKYRRLCVGMGAEPWRGRAGDVSEKELEWRDKRSFYHMLESLFDKPTLPEYDDNDDPFDDVF